jgi:hypothetical protein
MTRKRPWCLQINQPKIAFASDAKLVDVVVHEPRGVLGSLDELLRRPTAGFERARVRAPVGAWEVRVLAGSLGCSVLLSGAASGFSPAARQIGIAAVNASIIIIRSALLCLASLYVFRKFLRKSAPRAHARSVSSTRYRHGC